eukprot:TRINITY_DN7316_c0_g1_i1.p1 TRINITY_DN7316_c0_g1~~TRINITY_DN7316_c0_g1_i1.p1  ORF type:complete len:953 (-),score=155.34 TRINITY_DN7316_c0_g1_i1:37-2895(-)
MLRRAIKRSKVRNRHCTHLKPHVFPTSVQSIYVPIRYVTNTSTALRESSDLDKLKQIEIEMTKGLPSDEGFYQIRDLDVNYCLKFQAMFDTIPPGRIDLVKKYHQLAQYNNLILNTRCYGKIILAYIRMPGRTLEDKVNICFEELEKVENLEEQNELLHVYLPLFQHCRKFESQYLDTFLQQFRKKNFKTSENLLHVYENLLYCNIPYDTKLELLELLLENMDPEIIALINRDIRGAFFSNVIAILDADHVRMFFDKLCAAKFEPTTAVVSQILWKLDKEIILKTTSKHDLVYYVDVMKDTGIVPDLNIYNSLILYYGKTANIMNLIQTYNTIKTSKLIPDATTFRNAKTYMGVVPNHEDRKLQLYSTLLYDGMEFDTNTCEQILDLCYKTGDFKMARVAVSKMKKVGLILNLKTLTLFIKTYRKTGLTALKINNLYQYFLECRDKIEDRAKNKCKMQLLFLECYYELKMVRKMNIVYKDIVKYFNFTDIDFGFISKFCLGDKQILEFYRDEQKNRNIPIPINFKNNLLKTYLLNEDYAIVEKVFQDMEYNEEVNDKTICIMLENLLIQFKYEEVNEFLDRYNNFQNHQIYELLIDYTGWKTRNFELCDHYFKKYLETDLKISEGIIIKYIRGISWDCIIEEHGWDKINSRVNKAIELHSTPLENRSLAYVNVVIGFFCLNSDLETMDYYTKGREFDYNTNRAYAVAHGRLGNLKKMEEYLAKIRNELPNNTLDKISYRYVLEIYATNRNIPVMLQLFDECIRLYGYVFRTEMYTPIISCLCKEKEFDLVIEYITKIIKGGKYMSINYEPLCLLLETEIKDDEKLIKVAMSLYETTYKYDQYDAFRTFRYFVLNTRVVFPRELFKKVIFDMSSYPRTKPVTDIMNRMEVDMGYQLDIDIYNCLFEMFLKKKDLSSFKQYMTKMSNDGIERNEKTLEIYKQMYIDVSQEKNSN